MNVNSRGHNLDTRFYQLFLGIKHPPGLKTRWVYPPPRIGLKNINPSRTDLRVAGHFFVDAAAAVAHYLGRTGFKCGNPPSSMSKSGSNRVFPCAPR